MALVQLVRFLRNLDLINELNMSKKNYILLVLIKN